MLKGGKRNVNEGGMGSSGVLDNREKTIAIQYGGKICVSFCVVYGRNLMSTEMMEVSIRRKNGAPSCKGCVINGEMKKASNSRPPVPLAPAD